MNDSVDYKTRCPRCGEEELYVSAECYCTSMPLSEDGWSFLDAAECTWDNEVITCVSCGEEFGLDDVIND